MMETNGKRSFCKTLSGRDEKKASGSGLIAAKVFGVTSEKIKITMVRRIDPINTPTSPYSFINNIVVSAEARIFTKLFPMRIIPNNLSGLLNNFSILMATLFFSFAKYFNRYLLIAIMLVSDPEKKADKISKIKILARRSQMGRSFNINFCSYLFPNYRMFSLNR